MSAFPRKRLVNFCTKTRAMELARERRRIMEALLAEGFSQADLARELGVTRQVIQKMIAVGAERRGK